MRNHFRSVAALGATTLMLACAGQTTDVTTPMEAAEAPVEEEASMDEAEMEPATAENNVLLAEWTEEGSKWSMRLRSRDGVDFKGRMTSPDYDEPTSASLTCWVSPRGGEWLLDGVFGGEEGDVAWQLVLFPAE